MDDVRDLSDTLVIEAGVRQAWPFLTLLDSTGERQRRLYVDAEIRLEPASSAWTDQDDARTLGALATLVNLWIRRLSIESDGDLRIVFDNGAVLTIRSQGNAKTTSEPWRVTALM
jgi:hypothetical protein